MISSLSRLTLANICLFSLLIHLAGSSRIPFGPMSQLTGTAVIIDKILSPGNSRKPAPTPVDTKTNNSTVSRKPKDNQAASDFYGATCSISFTKRTIIRQTRRSLQERKSRRNLDPMKDDERSALFLTEAAEKCVESSRTWGMTSGYPLGVGVCYSVGYVDAPKSVVGGQVNVFRLGTVSELSGMSGIDVDELEQSTRLELSFLSKNSPDDSPEYTRSSLEGALRLTQPSWAPPDDPNHLINPTNPHYTASYGATEMVLIGSFHLNLLDPHRSTTSRIRKRDDMQRLTGLSPSGARVVSQDTPILESHFFDLSDRPAKRSALVGTQPWGLFKRQEVASVASSNEFSSDPGCAAAGLAPNPFFTGDGKDAPISAANEEQTPERNFLSEPEAVPLIPPSPFLSPVPQDISTSVTMPSTFMRANSLLSVTSINFNSTAYQLPGRYLMVLPVGLIIYGALSALALLAVMVVTYERKQYRDQFRSRMKEQKKSPPTDLNEIYDKRV
ncbi:hypothetical protein Pst134EA_015396 [Puccinia striiformis f. sp. tritici]|uniref:hypothetical protein n=1 Tax=Puccinia striiformis f. sp. tritici TaxID=168172 RepID=UPI00200794A9|nr:hypothetical protein Pst134EA_015396 [Puccinia striiformis f. sp. tritici]KAH9463313.1 hypothetical protein Pst134EA_015396 [Puccinia striiformis f. sp. tritici]